MNEHSISLIAVMRTGSTSTAVVTGAGGGIGAAIAQALAAEGASVAVSDIDLDAAAATAELIADQGGSAAPFQLDVTNADSVQQLRKVVEETFGAASVLVNNAGWGQPELFVENEPAVWEKLVAVNFLGQVTVTRAFIDPMIESEGGRIVNIASDAGRVGSSGETVYAGTKGGVIAFTKSLARELARYRINVNCVCPGPTDTALFHKHTDKMQEALVRAIPFRRLAQPEEIADAVAFFASERASFITGQVLSVSGGLTMVD
jgi:2-hydroxycyclohexanecarboxyl-CoA dehydrogenase